MSSSARRERYSTTSRRSYSPEESHRKRHHTTPREERNGGRDRDERRDRKEGGDRKLRSRDRSEDPKGRRSPLESDHRRHHAHRHRHRHRSRSASPKRSRRDEERGESPSRFSRKPLPTQEESYRAQDPGTTDAVGKPIEKEKPNFKATGLLAAETNKVTFGSSKNPQSIVLKYHEPPEARKAPSSETWIMYVFKGASQEPLDTIPLHTRSCWLLGREAAVADVLIEHPSCSKQHAVLQFRHTVKKDEWGEKKDKVGLYVLDLESANATFLNGEKIEAARYVQCISGDVLKFGDSAREYVILLPPK